MRNIQSIVLITVLTGSFSLACCMLPATYKGTISQNAHEAVLIHHNGREELVLRIDYRIVGKTMPEQFAWVITVPNEPDKYALADAKLFEDMFDLSEALLRPRTNSRSFGSLGEVPKSDAKPDGIELGKRVQIGPYDIQPVRGVGANALTGLNNWLKKNNFPTEDPAHMGYFVDRKFTFLAIRITPPKDKKTVGSGGKVRPLHLSFKTYKPYYPLRFSSRQGVFDVNLHVLTRTKLDYKVSKGVLKQINWTNTDYKRNHRLQTSQMPKTLKDLFRKTTFAKQTGSWYYNNIRGERVNRKDNLIARWKTDVFFNGQPRFSSAAAGSTTELGVSSNLNKQLRYIAATYLKGQLVNPGPMVAPTDCFIPPTKILYSQARGTSEHGRKLFYLFARQAAPLRLMERIKAQPVGQYLVKETWEAVPSGSSDRQSTGRHPSGHFLSKSTTHEGRTLATGKPLDLYIMLKQERHTEDNDEGWVYAVLSRDGETVRKAGRIQSCIDCHEDARYDRILGDYIEAKSSFKIVPFQRPSK